MTDRRETLRARFLDELVRDKLRRQGVDPVRDGYIDERGRLDYDRVPSHLRGSLSAMIENARPVVGRLLAAVDDYEATAR